MELFSNSSAIKQLSAEGCKTVGFCNVTLQREGVLRGGEGKIAFQPTGWPVF